MPATTRLSVLLTDWESLLQSWAADGSLSAAALTALGLPEESRQLQDLRQRLAQGIRADLPGVELLSAEAMGGALGAYASGSGTIYLNEDWLAGAEDRAALAVLTEELGHHLDAVLNTADTPGDEGAVFSQLLLGCLLYTSPSPRDLSTSRMPSSA